MSEEKRIGNQIPTTAVIRDYEESLASEALALYNSGADRKALKWQETLLTHIMAVDDDGLYRHMRFGY